MEKRRLGVAQSCRILFVCIFTVYWNRSAEGSGVRDGWNSHCALRVYISFDQLTVQSIPLFFSLLLSSS
jgi:hypothetical protein